MKRILISLSCGLAICLAATTASASDAEDFVVDSTQDLVDLCAVSTDDSDYRAALHFCHGFMVGAYHYHAITEGEQNPVYFCAPDPAPTRNEIVNAFVKWAKAHPEHAATPAVESEFRFLAEVWPCKQ